MPTKKKNPAKPVKTGSKKEKVHPWRLCPGGQHWVRTHPLHIPPSRRHPDGSETIRHEHCALNPSGKDQMYPIEMQRIATDYFSTEKNKPCPIELIYRRKGSQYDNLIAGWVHYWNDVPKPTEPLTPNLVKALIASESDFIPDKLANKKNQNSARGLMQITNATRKILGDEKGELKDHYLNVTREELNDPNVNICSGIRWLFYKRERRSKKLGRPATWVEAVYEYKGASTASKKRAHELMDRFLEYFGKLEKCAK